MPPALYDGYAIYQYTPSIVAAVIFVILFAIATAAHLWRMIRAKTYFCIPFVIGGLFELVGYAGRCASHYNPPALTPYIIQSTLLLVAPALFAATIYMFLGRIIRSVNAESLSPIRTKYLTSIFVTGDVLSFFVQGGGAGILTKGSAATGQDIILAGLFLQIAMFGVFLAVGLVFANRMKHRERTSSLRTTVPWSRMMNMLFAVSTLILLRNIFRVIEYFMGQTGYLLAHEWSLYIFDSVPMLGVMALFFVGHPMYLYVGRNDMEMSGGGMREEGNVKLTEDDVRSVRSS